MEESKVRGTLKTARTGSIGERGREGVLEAEEKEVEELDFRVTGE